MTKVLTTTRIRIFQEIKQTNYKKAALSENEEKIIRRYGKIHRIVKKLWLKKWIRKNKYSKFIR